MIDLQTALNNAYDAGPYLVRVNYSEPPVPPLEPDDEQWAKTLLAKRSSPNT